jgi:ABC-type Fe3+-siderophore transport system permease subunit
MAEARARQDRLGAVFVSIASVLVAVMEWAGRPAEGEFVEAEPDWYVTFTAFIHGAILLVLLIALARVGKMTADKPGLRLPFTLMILVGIAAGAYVLGRDLGLV